MDSEDRYGLLSTQQYYLPMLREFDQYCRNHDVKYSLAYGTLLGAIRHKGFIPWDDDIDVVFDRENYQKFLQILNDDPLQGYKIIGELWIKKLTRVDNPKIISEGQCIDLFVFDPIPANKAKAVLKVFLLKALQGMIKDKPDYQSYSFLYKVISFILHLVGLLFDKQRKLQWYDKLSQWTGKEKTQQINIYNGLFSQIGTKKYSKDIIKGYVPVRFEEMEVMAIVGYDSYLTELYGDYMVLPPEEQRIPKHAK